MIDMGDLHGLSGDLAAGDKNFLYNENESEDESMNIAGAKDHTGHDNAAQKSIWHILKMLSPFEAVNVDISGFESADIVTGEKEFYQFMKALYEEMYTNLEKFAISTTAYTKYMKKKETNPVFIKLHKKDTYESALRNAFQQAIQFYPNFFFHIGVAADELCPDTYSLIISKSKYRNLLQIINRPYSLFREGEKRLAALTSAGIVVSELDGMYHLSCQAYPKMFLGLWVLCRAPKTPYKYMNFLRLDYKGFNRDMPDVDDIKRTMKDAHTGYVDSLIKLFEHKNMRYKITPLRSIVSGNGWKIRFILKEKSVFGFFSDPDYLALYLYFNDAKNISEMASRLQDTDPELFDWFCDQFPERLCKCPNNRTVVFGTVRKRICGLSNKAEVVDPNDDDIRKSMMVLKIFRGIDILGNIM